MSLRNSIYLFFKPGLRNKVKIIYTTKQNQIVPVPPPCQCLFTIWALLLGGTKDTAERKDFVLDPGPAPDTISQVGEDGREIEVLDSVYRAGQDPAHPYPFCC